MVSDRRSQAWRRCSRPRHGRAGVQFSPPLPSYGRSGQVVDAVAFSAVPRKAGRAAAIRRGAPADLPGSALPTPRSRRMAMRSSTLLWLAAGLCAPAPLVLPSPAMADDAVRAYVLIDAQPGKLEAAQGA